MRQPIVITKPRKPVARLVALEPDQPGRFIGCLEGAITILGDIEAPTEGWLDARLPPGPDIPVATEGGDGTGHSQEWLCHSSVPGPALD